MKAKIRTISKTDVLLFSGDGQMDNLYVIMDLDVVVKGDAGGPSSLMDVRNIHWTSANMDYILEKAAESPEEPDLIKEFSQNMVEIPVNPKETLDLQTNFLKFYNITTEGTKGQFLLQVLTTRSRTKHQLFERAIQDLLSLI